jgi:AcrR family transcriptional regulator
MSDAMSSSPPAQSLREQHEAVTRQAILRAAREAFAERGFQATSMKLLAERAGVAVQTIYSTFGSKAGVLTGLVDLVDREAGVLELAQEMRQANDPRRLLRLGARTRRQIRERCGDIIAMLRAGAGTDERIAAVWEEGLRRRHQGLTMTIDRLGEQGALRAGLDRRRAADVAAALVADDVCDVLVLQRGWSFDEYEDWLADTLALHLLG